MKDELLHQGPPIKKRKDMTSCGPFWVLKKRGSLFGCVIPAHLLSDSRAASFKWGPKREKALQQMTLLCKLLHHLDHMIQQMRWCLKCQ